MVTDDRISADPGALEALTREGLAAVRAAAIDVAAHETALRAYATAPVDGSLAPELHVLTGWVRDALADLALLDREPAAFAAALRTLDRYVPDTPDQRRWRTTLDVAAFEELVRVHLAAPADVDPASLEQHVTTLRRAARTDLAGTTRWDLGAVEQVVHAVDAPTLDLVLARLDDDEVARLLAALAPPAGRLEAVSRAGWTTRRRWEVLDAVLSRVSPVTLDRLIELGDVVDPDPAEALPPSETDPRDVANFAALRYQRVALPLFAAGDEPSVDDLEQGAVGNCFLVTALLTQVRSDPEAVRRMFRRNPNGTVTVTFADGTPVTVTPRVVIHPNQPWRPVFGSTAGTTGSDTQLWPLLLEKAAVQALGGWVAVRDGGRVANVLPLTTGHRPRRLPTRPDLATLAAVLAAGGGAAVTTRGPASPFETARRVSDDAPEDGDDLAHQHAYLVVGTTDDGVLLLDPNHTHAEPFEVPHDDLRMPWVTWTLTDGPRG